MAFLGGSFINAYIMSKMKIKHAGKKFALRAIVSSLAGECVDTFIFTVCGFAFAIPTTALFQIILTETVLKTLFEIVLLPITQKIVRSLKKSNQTDIYDNNISYNILRIKDLD